MTATLDSVPLAGRREWLGLAVLALPTLVLSLDMSVLYLALPTMSADLDPSSTQQLWIIDIYGFMVAGLLITMGNIGDRIGRRRIMLIGGAVFAVASVGAAYSTSADMLIACRALMGVAGATLMPSAMALIGVMFHDPRQRGVAIAAWMSCFQGGLALGPVVGGLLLHSFWWGSVFLIAVPIMALLLTAGPRYLPEFRNPSPGRIDVISVVLSLGAILPAIYGLKELARHGIEPAYVGALVVGLVLGVIFVRRQRSLADPLVDLSLLTTRRFRAALALFMLPGVVGGGVYLLVTQYLQTVQGLSPLHAGLWLMPSTFAMVAGTMATPALAQRFGPASVMAIGLVVAASGFFLISQVDRTSPVLLIIAGHLVSGIGVAPVTALVPEIMVGSAPPEKAGSAASIMGVSAELGIALGVATLGSVGSAVYRGEMSDRMPAGLPEGISRAAHQSVEGALATAQHLHGLVRGDVLDAARAAFASGLGVVATIGALVFVGLSVLAATALRTDNAAKANAPVMPDPADLKLSEVAVHS
jgi:DHA2 family multidrug resistance protein-like MFS transporter